MQTFEAPSRERLKANVSLAGKNRSFFSPVTVQPKLTINQPNDPYEQEADAMADKVMRMEQPGIQLKPLSITSIQRKCEHCEEEEKKMQRKEMNGEEATGNNNLESYVASLSSGGQPLPNEVRNFYEPRFGYDFSNVKVHTDSIASKSAQSINALAYTSGNNIVFNNGQYSPGTDSGKRLLGHELAHVVQQSSVSSHKNKLSENPGNNHISPATKSITGKGTIQRKTDLTATRFSGNKILEQAYDGIAIISKTTNRNGGHVRLIQEALLALGYTLPLFGADGIFGNETETKVNAFQVDNGGKGDGIVGKETMHLLDMKVPGSTVGLAGPSPAAATASVFSEDADEQFAGYDASVAPNWLVVPINGRRLAKVTATPAGSFPAYVSDTPGVAIVDRTSTGIVVTGISKGIANVKAMEGATVLATLRITVKNQLNRSVAFHYVCDSAPAAAGGPHCSNHSPTPDAMRTLLNNVWHLQANVMFTGGAGRNVVAPGNLGTQVDDNGTGGGEMGIVTALGSGANFNVFRVGDLTSTVCGGDHRCSGGATNGNNTMIADAPCADGLGLPHEAGHFLGLGHGSGFIMTPCTTPRLDKRVDKAMADIVNP